MGFYERRVLPRLIDWACGLTVVDRQRRKVVPQAEGEVLEVGIGPGHNLEHYDPSRVRRLVAIDPSPEMLELAARRARALGRDVELLEAGAERIPLPDAAVDAVLLTYTLCTVPEPHAALREIRRVLRPSGQLLFCEHGAAPDPAVRKWQDRVTPLWRRFAGGCHLNRDVPALLAAGGFSVDEPSAMYLPGWRPATWNVWGVARPTR
jgi:ubiquinone/menaquinone biosynthesis C-methylase UbiE